MELHNTQAGSQWRGDIRDQRHPQATIHHHGDGEQGAQLKTFLRRRNAGFAQVIVGLLASAEAAQVTIQANANVVKALEFTSKQDLDFGMITPAAVGTTTVSMSMAGAITCPAGSTCTGAPRPAIFNVQGTNRMVVLIYAAASDLVNTANGSTIRFTPSAPTSITLVNSGQPGSDFNVGGSIAIPSTADGTYVGTIQVTADYQ